MPATVAVNSDFSKQTNLPDGDYKSIDLQNTESKPFKNFLIDRNGIPRLSAYETDSNSKICLYTEDNFNGLIDDLPKTGDVASMGVYNDKVKSLKIKPVCKPCGDNEESFNNTEYFANEPSKTSSNTNFYLLILLLIIAYFFFYKK